MRYVTSYPCKRLSQEQKVLEIHNNDWRVQRTQKHTFGTWLRVATNFRSRFVDSFAWLNSTSWRVQRQASVPRQSSHVKVEVVFFLLTITNFLLSETWKQQLFYLYSAKSYQKLYHDTFHKKQVKTTLFIYGDQHSSRGNYREQAPKQLWQATKLPLMA